MTGIIKRAGGAFVVVFLLIVGVTAVGGVVLDSNPTPEPVADDHWQLDTVTPDGVDEGGTINMESTESSNTVVVHLGRGRVAASAAQRRYSRSKPLISLLKRTLEHLAAQSVE